MEFKKVKGKGFVPVSGKEAEPLLKLGMRKRDIKRGRRVAPAAQMPDTPSPAASSDVVRMFREHKRREYRSSLFLFAKYCLDNPDIEVEAHGELCQTLQDMYWGVGAKEEHRKGIRKLLVMMPRGTLKSTIVTIAFPLWIFMQDDPAALERYTPMGEVAWQPPKSFNGKKGYNQRILISNAVDTFSQDFLKTIKQHLTRNEELIETFGSAAWEKKTDGLWTNDAINIAWRDDYRSRDPNILCGAMNKAINSGHFDLGLNDDMINEKYVTTQEMIEKTIDFHRQQHPVLEKPSIQVYVGTHWHDADLYDYLRTSPAEKAQFTYIIERAIRSDEEVAAGKRRLFCETKHSLEWLEKERELLGDYFFSCQYQNDPIDQETALFKASYFDGQVFQLPEDPVSRDRWLRSLNIFTVSDPAISQDRRGCRAVIATLGMDHEARVFLLDLFARKACAPSDYIDEFYRQVGLWRPMRAGIEKVGFQELYIWNIQQESLKRGVFIPWVELEPKGRSKEKRIEKLEPIVRPKKFFYQAGHQDVVHEFLRYPYGKTRDLIDTLAYLLDVAFPAEKEEEDGFEFSYETPDLESHLFADMMLKRREHLIGGSGEEFDWYND